MAVDMFLKIPGVDGESTDSKHKGEIDVLAWSWGLSNAANAHVGGGSGAGKVNVQDVSLTKYVDKASPTLFLRCCDGKHFDKAFVYVRKSGGTPLEYLKLEMDQVFVSAVSTGGSGGEDRLTENVTLNFATVKVTYQEQDPKGGPKGGPIEKTWKIAENIEG